MLHCSPLTKVSAIPQHRNTATPAASSITSGVAISLRRAHLALSTGPCRHQKVCVSTRQGYSSLIAKTFPMPSATFVLYKLRSCHCNATDKAFAVHVVLAGTKSLLCLLAAPNRKHLFRAGCSAPPSFPKPLR